MVVIVRRWVFPMAMNRRGLAMMERHYPGCEGDTSCHHQHRQPVHAPAEPCRNSRERSCDGEKTNARVPLKKRQTGQYDRTRYGERTFAATEETGGEGIDAQQQDDAADTDAAAQADGLRPFHGSALFGMAGRLCGWIKRRACTAWSPDEPEPDTHDPVPPLADDEVLAHRSGSRFEGQIKPLRHGDAHCRAALRVSLNAQINSGASQ